MSILPNAHFNKKLGPALKDAPQTNVVIVSSEVIKHIIINKKLLWVKTNTYEFVILDLIFKFQKDTYAWLRKKKFFERHKWIFFISKFQIIFILLFSELYFEIHIYKSLESTLLSLNYLTMYIHSKQFFEKHKCTEFLSKYYTFIFCYIMNIDNFIHKYFLS